MTSANSTPAPSEPSDRSLRAVMDALTGQLAAAGILEPQVDAELLVGHVLGVSRGELAAQLVLEREVTPEQAQLIAEMGARRASREPLQHITGHAYFRSLDLAVGPGVFVPRPETELLAQIVIDHVRTLPDPQPLVVDFGTGSGAIALAVATEVPHARVVAVEKSPDAHAWTTRNIASSGATNIELILGDLTDALPDMSGRFAVVVSNPPYIPTDAIPRDPEVRLHDPVLALYGGADGLDLVRVLDTQAARLLQTGGLFALEHGESQGDEIAALLRASGWRVVATHRDLLGRDRYTTALRG